MFGNRYILKGKIPVIMNDLTKWAIWMKENDPKVAHDNIKGVFISTVFLGFDHSILKNDDPILFETMVFGGRHDLYQRRYSTWDQAEEGHKAVIDMVKKSLLKVINGGNQ